MGLRAGVPLHSSSGMSSQPILSDGIYGSFGPDDDVTQLGASSSNFDSFRFFFVINAFYIIFIH